MMKEVRMDVRSEFAMNLINYLIIEENYIYVGNEREVWLENLSHPAVQLIYLNQKSIYNEEQGSQLFYHIERIRSQVRKRYLMWRLNVVVLNLDKLSAPVLESGRRFLRVFNIPDPAHISQEPELQSFYPAISTAPLERPMGDLVVEIQTATKKKAMEVHKTLSYQATPLGTLSLLVVTLGIFAYLQLIYPGTPGVGAAILYGAKYNPLIYGGQYWRLLTSSLLHIDLMHLLLNLVFLYQFGKLVETTFGWWRLLLIMIASAFMGGLFSYAFVTNVSLGASGIAYGLLGALLFLGIENRKMFMGIVRNLVFPILLLSLFWVMVDPVIDGYSHLGGLAGGFLSATILGIPKYPRNLFRNVLTVLTAGILISGLFIRGGNLTRETDFNSLNQSLIQYHLEQGRPDRAEAFHNALPDYP